MSGPPVASPRPAPTPSQTIGPFFGPGLTLSDGARVVPEGAAGAIWIRGRLLDGDGEPVPDGLIETWQVDPAGRPAGPDFRGWGRCATDADGHWAILTIKPGAASDGVGVAAPHLDVSVFARGLLRRAVTRIYFADEPSNDIDTLLASIEPTRRATLIAAAEPNGYRFQIRLQGEGETVFFSV